VLISKKLAYLILVVSFSSMGKKKHYKILDLFAGIGGFSLGFKRYNDEAFYPFQVIAALEKDKIAAETLIHSFISQGYSEESAREMVICGDITLDETKEKLYNICKDVDIIIGGPPCQSFSMIGPRSGDKQQQEKYLEDDRDNLFEHYIEIVEHYNPLFFIFENVKGLLSKKNNDGFKYIDLIMNRFESIGYSLELENSKNKKYALLNAANFGVPQNRERVIVIGNKLNFRSSLPKQTHCSEIMVPALDLRPFVTLADAIGDLPSVVPKLTYTLPEKSKTRKKPAITQDRKEYIDSLNKHRDCGLDEAIYPWSRFLEHYNSGNNSRKEYLNFIKPRKKDSLLVGHKARSQQECDVNLFKEMDQGMTANDLIESENIEHKELAKLIKYNMSSFKDKYKKLCWNQPSNTIVAHLQKDGNRYIHPDSLQARTLTVREAARLQSFPDDYEIKATGNARYKYIGNAVPPLLSLAIAKELYKNLLSLE
jgi:DNA (cytosine-5)-methyltransferase 1